MSLRKLVSLLLLVTFVASSVTPAMATVTLDAAGLTTLPTLAPDVGTAANGANRDVVPVNLRVNFTSGDITFGKVTGLNAVASTINGNLTITANGKLSIANGGTLATPRAVIFTPPSGTKFVRLPIESYATPKLQLGNGSAANNILQSTNIDVKDLTNSNLPGTGSNGNVVLADILTLDGPSTYFGNTLSAGSLIAYFVTKHEGSDQNTSAGSVVFNGFGLAADPAASPTTSGSATVTYFEPAGSISEAMPSLSTSNTANIGTYGSQAGKVEFLIMGDKTGSETSTTTEPDSQSSSVLASLLTSAGTTVTAGPGLVTTTSSGVSSLKLDLDALILRASERGDSTTSSRKFYETPFATSAFVTATALSDNGGTTTLNTALTDTTAFPNTTNALMSVLFELQDPTTGAASTATLKVNAVSISLLSPRAFDGYRGQIASSVGGATQSLSGLVGNGGFLGALAFAENGGAVDSRVGVGVIYNGTSSSSRLVLKDATALAYGQQVNQIGFNGRTANTSVPSTGLSPSSIINGTTLKGIFPGSLVTSFDNGATTSTWGKVATAVDNGTGVSAFTLVSAFNTNAFDNGEPIYTPGEVTARLVNDTAGASTGTNAWFFVAGSVAAGNNSTLGSFQVGPTNTATNLYSKGPNAKSTAGEQASPDSRNNAILAARLAGNTLQILPLVNKYDTVRDAIAIRPELTITLDSTAKTKGVNIVAKASGGNLSGTTSKTIGRILAAGSVTANITLQAVPVAGDSSSLMLEKVTDPGASRSLIALSSVTGASSSADEIDDLNGSTTALDTTIPPLFCGGSVGDGTRGPNGVVFQPKARAILIKENGTDAFKNLQDLGSNTVIRVSMPTGVDINAYNGSLANSQILGVIATGGSTFSVAPSIVRVQPISKNNGTTLSGAFVDVSLGTSGTPTQTATKRIIGLIFKPNALVVPVGTTNFSSTVSIVNTAGTSTRDGAVSDDITLTTVGTVALADACSTLFTLKYCDSGLSTYQKGSTATEIVSEIVSNGANLTSFSSTPSTTLRLVGNTADDITLPDLCIAEGVADALPVGQGIDGVPNSFGVGQITTNGQGVLHIASTFNGTASVGLKVGSSTNVFFSDSSINNGSALANVNQNEVAVTIKEGSASTRHRPFVDKTTITLRGLQMRKAASSSTVVPAQSFIAWFEALNGSLAYTVGSNNPQAFNVDTVNGVTALVNTDVGSAETNGMIAHFRNGNGLSSTFAGTRTASNFADSSSSSTTNTLTVVTTKAQPITLSGAVTTIFDNASFTKLADDTTFTVATSAITGSTDKTVEVSVKAGTLEPGSVVTLTTTGTGSQDTVTVPVLDDGSFKAKVRAGTSQTITVIQTPDSQLSSVPAQVASLTVSDQNIAPTLESATFVDIGLGDVSARGTVPVVFEVTASGKLNGSDYVPVASELTLGGNPVTAVSGSTTQFIGVVDFSADDNLTVTSTAGDDSSVELSGLTAASPTGAGKPKLTKATVNAAGTLVLKGTGLTGAGTAGFVLDDATFSPITLAARTKTDKEKSRRRALSTSIPTNATHVIFNVAGKGVSALEL